MSIVSVPEGQRRDAEEAVIAAFIQDSRAARLCLDGLALSACEFEDPQLALMFAAILSLEERQIESDPITLGTELSLAKNLERAGGKDRIGFLVDAVSDGKNVLSYAKIVREGHQRRVLASQLRAAAINAESSKPLGTVVDELSEIVSSRREDVSSAATYLTLGELLAHPDLVAEPLAIVPNLLYAGRTTLLSSREKMGKSTLTGQAAAAVSSGQEFLGTILTRVPVMWYAIDEPQGDAARRLQRFGADPDRLYISQQRVTAQQLRVDVQQSGAQVVFIDTLSELWAGRIENENDAQQVTMFLRPYIEVVRETGVALMFSYHTNKIGREFRGSVALGATVDAPLTLNRIGSANGDHGMLPAGTLEEELVDDDGRRVVSGTTRWGKVAMRLTFDGERYLIGNSSMPLSTRILNAVREGVTTVSALSKELGKRKETVVEEVALLIKAGVLERHGKFKLALTSSGDELTSGAAVPARANST